jgi:hypothetical protein
MKPKAEPPIIHSWSRSTSDATASELTSPPWDRPVLGGSL